MIMEENNDILSKFDSLKNNDPYKVPENYFDTLLTRIQEKIEKTGKQGKPGWVFTYRPLVRLSFLIVGICFIAFIGYNVLKPFWNSSNDKYIDEVAMYLDNQIFLFDDYTLVSISDVIQNKSNEKSNEQNDTINYLINSNIGFEDIINNL
jgi:hypothetical protein